MTTTGNTILAALNLMRTGRWLKNSLSDSMGGYCAVGAVQRAGSKIGWLNESYPFPALAAHIPEDFDAVEEFKRTRPGWGLEIGSRQKCVAYNNSRESFDEIVEWFEKTAYDEGVTL